MAALGQAGLSGPRARERSGGPSLPRFVALRHVRRGRSAHAAAKAAAPGGIRCSLGCPQWARGSPAAGDSRNRGVQKVRMRPGQGCRNAGWPRLDGRRLPWALGAAIWLAIYRSARGHRCGCTRGPTPALLPAAVLGWGGIRRHEQKPETCDYGPAILLSGAHTVSGHGLRISILLGYAGAPGTYRYSGCRGR